MDVVELFDNVYSEDKKATFWRYDDESFNFDTDILLCFSPTNYHSFILCKDIEFHPHFSYNKTRISQKRRNVIRAGAFIAFRGIKKEQIDRFYDYLLKQKDTRFPSCHMGVVEVLKNGLGIDIDGSFKSRYHPSRIINLLINNITPYNPPPGLSLKLYLLKDRSPAAVEKGIQFFENKFYYGYWISDIYLISRNLMIKLRNLFR